MLINGLAADDPLRSSTTFAIYSAPTIYAAEVASIEEAKIVGCRSKQLCQITGAQKSCRVSPSPPDRHAVIEISMPQRRDDRMPGYSVGQRFAVWKSGTVPMPRKQHREIHVGDGHA